MPPYFWLIIIRILFLVIGSGAKAGNLKLCVVGDLKSKPGHVVKYCGLLGNSKKSPIECVFAVDRLECIRMVSNRDADLTVLKGEDLYFSTLWSESDMLVVSEIRALQEMKYKFRVVVVVRNSININGVNLKGQRMCFPGLKSGSYWTDFFAQYLEERLAPRNCEANISTFEDRIKTSAEFFGDSCKTGPWTEDKKEDVRLKLQYSSMCSLCEMGDCSDDEKFRGSVGSFLCLTVGAGDVVWGIYEDLKPDFKKLSEGIMNTLADYSFLCENGTLIPLNVNEPCIWLAKPWQVIAANRKSFNEVQKIFHDMGDSEWMYNFFQVTSSFTHYIVNLDVPKTPEDYLRSIPGYLSALELAQGNCKPQHSVRLCTTSAIEQEKCMWISKAALSVGVQPMLECFLKQSEVSCLESVANGTTDLVVVNSDYVLDATKYYGLTTLYYELPNQEVNGYLLSALVKGKNFKNLQSLKLKTACFTKKHGVGWNSALYVLKENNLINRQGNLKEFFKHICVMSNNSGEDLALCCNGDNAGEDDEKRAVKCLLSHGCDVAFVDKNVLSQFEDEPEWKDKLEEVNEVCHAETDCTWAWAFPSSLMINSNTANFKFEEISYFLSVIGNMFGKKSKNENSIMEIFAPFNKIKNVLFKDTSVTFARVGRWSPKNDYQEIVNDLNVNSGGSNFLIKRSLHVICIFFTLFRYL